MTRPASTLKPHFTVFMLVKTAPEWLGFTVARVRELALEQLAPTLSKHTSNVSLRFFDVRFYSNRVTDIWIWAAKDVHAYHHLLEDLRADPFWNRYFKIVEILAGVEDAHARRYYRELISTWNDPGFADARAKTRNVA